MFGIPGYLVPVFIYAFIYVGLYLVPFFWRLWGKVRTDTIALSKRAEREVKTERKRQTGVADTVEEADFDDVGLMRSTTLESDFASDLVNQAVQQLKTKFPQGAFTQFEIERLPAYSAYQERVSSARSMAGIFVLMGLLGTLWKLNQVVEQIGGAAAAGEMEASAFLDRMGLIMQDTGGAFLSTIYGLGLMVLAIIVVGLFDRWRQGQVDKLDETMQTEVVPALVRIKEMRDPTRSVADEIEKTSTMLSDLGSAVRDVKTGMTDSLEGLSDEINHMLQEFGAFSTQYARLDDLSKRIREYTEAVDDVTRSIEGAGRTLTNPINKMNHELNHTIREHMGVVGDSIEQSASDRAAIAQTVQQLQQDLQRTVAELRDVTTSSLDQVEAHRKQMDATLQQQQDAVMEAMQSTLEMSKAHREEVDETLLKQQTKLMEAIELHRDATNGFLKDYRQAVRQTLEKQHEMHQEAVREELDRLDAQHDTITTELKAVAEALEAANSEALAETLDRLDHKLKNTTGKLSGSASDLSKSAKQLRQVSKSLELQEKGPLTAFDWARRNVQLRKWMKQINGS